MTDDAINPAHYRAANGWESIDVIEAFFPTKPHRWPAMKYLVRAGKKPGQDEVQDLRKAIWWIEREIATIQKRGEPLDAEGRPRSSPVSMGRVLADGIPPRPIPVAKITGTDDAGAAHHSCSRCLETVKCEHCPYRGVAYSPWSFPGG